MVADTRRDTGAEVFNEGKRVCDGTADESSCPLFRSAIGVVRVLWNRQRAQVDPFVIRVLEGVGDRRGGNGEYRPGNSVEFKFRGADDL
jgi:hypothetical protein